MDTVRSMGIVGGGVMGGGIAQIMALAGFDVLVRDLSDEINASTRAEIVDRKWGLKRSVEKGKISFDQALEAMDRVHFTTEVADLAEVDFLIEAVPEDLPLKQDVFAELDRIVHPNAIFASNTSGFVIAEVFEKVSPHRRQRALGMHFSNPVPVMRMCEIVYTPETDEGVIDTARNVAERAGRAICMVRDTPGTYGFILNRVFAAARREALKIVEDGIASEEDVDRAMMTGRNWPAGFFGHRGGIGKQW